MHIFLEVLVFLIGLAVYLTSEHLCSLPPEDLENESRWEVLAGLVMIILTVVLAAIMI